MATGLGRAGRPPARQPGARLPARAAAQWPACGSGCRVSRGCPPKHAPIALEGAGNVIGFHPEGTRNKNNDPYTFLRPQPGVGKLIKDANPQVIPVFIAGLGNNLPKQVLGNWFGGPKIRIHFGAQLDLSEFIAKKDHVRTYKEIGDFLMSKIGELGEQDKEVMSNE